METLSEFQSRIQDFSILQKTDQIKYFAYFHQVITQNDGFTSKDITKYFDLLKLPIYSNIPQYLKINSSRNKKYYKKNNRYYLSPVLIREVEKDLSIQKEITPTNSLIDLEVFRDARTYIKEIAEQASICYDYRCYDACSVLIRRLLETLIIECYERKNIVSKIQEKGTQDFFGLDRLISEVSKESAFNISRNTRNSLPQLKRIGDMSAHNRRVLAKKSDIEKIRTDCRIAFEELLAIIDYQTWK